MSPQSRLYFDYNATSPLRPRAQGAMQSLVEEYGNPSSIHAEGRRARFMLEDARRILTDCLQCPARRLIVTASATEAANLALSPQGFGAHHKEALLLMSPLEHACILEGHRFLPQQVVMLAVDGCGRIDLAALESLLVNQRGRPLLCAVQAANNETGVVQDMAAISALVHAAGGIVVCDGAQAFGRIPFDRASTGADIMLVSGHKLGGPKGVGALALADGLEARGFDALGARMVRGGGQEFGVRAGTENLLALAGFAAGAQEALETLANEAIRLATLRDGLERGLTAAFPELVVFGLGAPRLPNTTLVAVPGVDAQTGLLALDLAGIAVSSGAACSSGKVARSHVLAAMGVAEDLATGAIRFSLGFLTTKNEIAMGLERMVPVLHKLRGRRGA